MLDAFIIQDPLQAQSLVVEGSPDIGVAVIAQAIQGEVAQLGKDTGLSTDPAGILAKGDVEGRVQAVSMPQCPRMAWASVSAEAARVTRE